MRNVPSYIASRLKSNIQTRANSSDPSARIWISRPSTVLVDDRLLERQVISELAVSDVSIAVCHPRMRRANSEIFVAYISEGVAKVVSANHKTKMDSHIWVDCGFSEKAEAISIAFDGTMPRVYGSEVEFVTEKEPWVFWVESTVLYARKLYSAEEPIVLAETNCMDVSAVRAMWSTTGSFDFGLVVFFLLNDKLYYRQLIDGEWMDAEPVLFGPDGASWIEIATFRTWDYRVGVQAKTSDGKVYELFTQYMGIAKQGTEHLNVDINSDVDLIKVTYHEPTPQEHISIAGIQTGAPYGGFYEVQPPHFVAAENVPDENGDWGRILKVVMSNHMRAKGVSDNAVSFVLTDERGLTAAATTATLDVEDGLTIVLTFVNFNSMKGVCSISYNPGDAVNMADTLLEYTEFNFTPVNLVPPDIPVPEPVALWNE